MDKVSSEILSLLQNVTNPIISQNYAKDVHSSVLDLKDAIDRTTHIINSAYNKKDISSQESKELQSHCRTTLDCFYRLTERLEAFSNNHLRSTGILLNPSISHTLLKIISARGSLTHKREPFYIYETTNGNNVCASCDVAPHSYQGECSSIKIEFKKENDNVIFKANLDKLLRDISRGVLETLDKYYNNLKTHLKSVGSKAT